LFDKEAILEYILHQKREISKKLKEFEKQKTKQQVACVIFLFCCHSNGRIADQRWTLL